MKNVGKIFEDEFKNSLPQYCWYKRLNDNASSFAGGNNTRFTTSNECDYLMFDCNRRNLFCVELKSTIGSLTYYREDFEEKGKHKSYNIKKSQIVGMGKWKDCANVICGFLFNIRNEKNETFFVRYEDFISYTSTLSKKSININDIKQMNPIDIKSNKLRVHYRYDIEGLCKNFSE